MQKNYRLLLLLVCAALLTGTAAQAQQILPKVWNDTSGTSWFVKTGNGVRSAVYNPVTKHVLVVSRDGGSNIIIFNAATGDSIGKMNMTGVSGGTYNLNIAGVSQDGKIFLGNLVTTANAASPFKVYAWANETAAPKLAFRDSVTGSRQGDALTVVGTGSETYIYAGGNGAPAKLQVLKYVNDSTLSLTKTITLASTYTGVLSIGPETNGFGPFWVNKPGMPLVRVDTNGTIVDSVTTSVVPSAWATVKYLNIYNRKYLLVTNSTSLPQLGYVVDITAGGAAPFIAAKTPSLGSIANSNGTGDMEWNPSDSTIIALASNNSFGAYKFKSPSVRVTFIANTATVPDTIKTNSIIQVRGGSASLTWGNDTQGQMTNNGGDYWTYTGAFPVGESFGYKYVTKINSAAGDGWENDLLPVNDRQMKVGSKDTTVMLEYVNGSPDKQLQFWRPYVPSNDSVAVMFRVNVQNEENFNKATMKMGVRGGTAPLDWGATFQLKQEQPHGNGGSRFYDAANFYSGVIKFPKSAVGTTVAYKFYVTDPAGGSLSWEGPIVGVPDNRTFTLPATDTTLMWKYWNNVGTKPPAGTDTASVTFTVNLAQAAARNSFKIGDTVLVQYGWANSAKTVTTDTLKRQGISGYNYKSTANLQVVGTKIDAAGTVPLYYQYYLVRGANTIRETYYNFNYTGTDNSLAERRSIAVTSKTLNAVDTSVILSNSNRQPFWRNTKQLARNVDLTLTCDLRPAYWQVSKGDTLTDIQGAFHVRKAEKDSIWKWGVYVNGPLSTGWQTWGATLLNDSTRRMYDDGTHGDKTAGDRIYTRIIKLYRDTTTYSNNTVGQEFKFGIRGGDNEGGKGGFGNNHIENIDDSQPTATLNAQFGSINPKFYNNWNFDTQTPVTGVAQTDNTVPAVYALEQNYPNPFNPTTTIRYQLPVSGRVSLVVYNVLGQEVMTLVNQTQAAGTYTATFDASRLASGMYLYRIEAGSFNSVKKMMLVK